MSRDLNELHPEIRPLIDGFLADVKAAGIDMIVTCTYRSFAEQNTLYEQGRTTPGAIVTNAQGGQSAHNYGLAVDVVPICNGKCVWNIHDPAWQKIGQIGQAHGLRWYGAPGAKFPETPHFELPHWEAYK